MKGTFLNSSDHSKWRVLDANRTGGGHYGRQIGNVIEDLSREHTSHAAGGLSLAFRLRSHHGAGQKVGENVPVAMFRALLANSIDLVVEEILDVRVGQTEHGRRDVLHGLVVVRVVVERTNLVRVHHVRHVAHIAGRALSVVFLLLRC